MHKDRFRTPANSAKYKENYDKIFGKETTPKAVKVPAEIQLRNFVKHLAQQIASQEELEAYHNEMGFEAEEDCYEDSDFNIFWQNIIIEARNLLKRIGE